LDGGSARRKACAYAGQHNRKTRTHIHASIGIRSHTPSVQVTEDGTCFRPRGHWDQRYDDDDDDDDDNNNNNNNNNRTYFTYNALSNTFVAKFE
jgi:hypothetical protein